MSDEKVKIYCWIQWGRPDVDTNLGVYAMGADGRVIASHISSSEGWARHDIGLESTWKHEHYDEAYGAGKWELEWVPQDQVETHEGLKAAYDRNQVLGEQHEKQMRKETIERKKAAKAAKE